MNSAPKVAVVIPCRDEIATLERCVRAVRSQEPAPAMVVVVDNGSVDGSRELAERLADRVVLSAEGPVARLRNLGAQAAGDCAVLAFVDADCEPLEGWLATALATLDDTTTVSARSEASPDASWVARRWAWLEARNAGEHSHPWSQHLVVRRSFFEALGGFDETMGTYEDWDLSERVRRAGGRSLLVPSVRVIHHGFPATLPAMVRRERWHTSTPGWVLRMSSRSRALVAVVTAWGVLGAAAMVAAVMARRLSPVAGWAFASVAGTVALGMLQGSVRHAPQDGVLLVTWALTRASRLSRGLEWREYLRR